VRPFQIAIPGNQKIEPGHPGMSEWCGENTSFEISGNQEMIGLRFVSAQPYFFTRTAPEAGHYK
jgi:hypothetical protein